MHFLDYYRRARRATSTTGTGPLFLDEGQKEDHLPLQPQLLGVVRQLPALAHQGGQGVRRPSLPYPPPTVILKFMYCLVGISTCPWPVQLAA